MELDEGSGIEGVVQRRLAEMVRVKVAASLQKK